MRSSVQIDRERCGRRLRVVRRLVLGAGAALVSSFVTLGAGQLAPAVAEVCADCEDGNGGGGGSTGSTAAVPDIAFQIRYPTTANGCLPTIMTGAITGEIRTRVRQALRAAGEADPAVDVRTQCANLRQTVAVWTAAVGARGSGDTDAARTSALGGVNYLQGNETIAIRVTSVGITRAVAKKFAESRHVNTAGQPSADGPIHLTDYQLSYYGPQYTPTGPRRMVARFDGYYDAPFPFLDVGFTATQSDSLWLSDGRIVCSSADTAYDMDTTLLDVFQVVTLALGQVVSPAGLFMLQGLIIFSQDDYPSEKGPACHAVGGIPPSIPLPGSVELDLLGTIAYKAAISYARLDLASNKGIDAGGTYSIVPRQPSVEVRGPSNPFRVDIEATYGEATFSVKTHDMRGTPTFTWVAPGATVQYLGSVDNGTYGRSVKVRWDTSNMSTATRTYRTVSVSVRDADGLVRGGSQVVAIERVPDASLPPVCDTHPERYECDPYHE